jgi:hypothetical protein
MNIMRKTGAAVALTGSLLLAGGALAGPAVGAPPAPRQDGLINVSVGDVTILEDVNVALGAKVAANICGVDVGPVAVLGEAVDRSGRSEVVCENNQGPITIEQN